MQDLPFSITESAIVLSCLIPSYTDIHQTPDRWLISTMHGYYGYHGLRRMAIVYTVLTRKLHKIFSVL